MKTNSHFCDFCWERILRQGVLVVGVVAVFLGASHTRVYAQSNNTARALEEVITTGSRITQSGMNTPTPVTMVTTDDLDLMAPGNIVEGLSQLPQFYGNSTPSAPAAFFVSPGSANLNLRGLGTQRTLVLLDGRRVVSSSRFGGTDISIFPEAMIKRVESVTGGASAAYGTDAVTGVSNFILDTEFTGIRGHVQGGITNRGDGENFEGAVSGGFDINERTHVLLSGDIYEQDGIFTYEGRDWYHAWGQVINPDPTGPAELIRPNVVSVTGIFNGLIWAPGSPLHRYEFSDNGNGATPFELSGLGATAPGPLFGQNNSQSITNGGSGDFIGADRPNVSPKFQRKSAFGYIDYDVNDNLTVYAQGLFGESVTTQANLGGQFQTVFSPMTILSGNAFLPASVQAALNDPSWGTFCDVNQTPADATDDLACFNLYKMGHSSDLAAGAWTTIDSSTYSITAGFDYDVETDNMFNGWNVKGYYQYGNTTTENSQIGGIRLDRIHMATDAVRDPASGNIVCNVTLVSGLYPDCVPYNPFGRGTPSKAAIDWVTGFEPGVKISHPVYYADTGYSLGVTDTYTSSSAKVLIADITQHVFEMSASGEIWKGWGAGAWSAAVGGGYRTESINQLIHSTTNPDANHDSSSSAASAHPVPANDPALGIRTNAAGDVNNTVGIQYSKVSNIRGDIDVTELYAEVLAPLVSGYTWMQQLNLSAAARWADYTGSGGIWSYKFGLDGQITDQIRLRGTYSRDVRAASLSERYDRTGGFATVNDPAMGGASFGIFQASGGNPSVNPEEADTWTFGGVYQPKWLDGLSLSVDWYEVSIAGAIGSLTPQQVVDFCYAGATDLCARVHRLPDGTLNLVEAIALNIDAARVSGVDIEGAYRTEVNWFGGGEQLAVRVFSSYLGANSITNFGSPKQERAGQLGASPNQPSLELPRWKVTANANYRRGPLSAFLQLRYISGGNLDNGAVEGVDIDNNHVDSVIYTDLHLSYDVSLFKGNWQVYADVTNLLDKDPPLVVNDFGWFGATTNQTNAGLHDLLGRRFTVGVRFNY